MANAMMVRQKLCGLNFGNPTTVTARATTSRIWAGPEESSKTINLALPGSRYLNRQNLDPAFLTNSYTPPKSPPLKSRSWGLGDRILASFNRMMGGTLSASISADPQ